MTHSETAIEPKTQISRGVSWGWVNVVIGSLAMTATLPGRTHGLGMIASPMLDDLKIGESTFSGLNLAAILAGSLLAWPTGQLIDRFGVRFVGALVAGGLGLAVIAMSEAQTVVGLFVGLLFVRGLGQGALSVASMAMVTKWFTKRLGVAMGVYSVLLGIGFIAATLIVLNEIGRSGWRDAWRNLGMCVVALGALAWLLVRNPATPSNASPLLGDICEGPDATLAEAARTPSFWVFTLASAAFAFLWSAITLFNESILAAHGFDRDDFVAVMAILAGSGLLANLVAGAALSFWPAGRIMAMGMLILAGSIASFPSIETKFSLMAYATTFGIAGGIVTVVFFTFYARAFGRRHVGLIQGVSHAISTVASALGPVALTAIHGQTGSYDGLFWTMAPLTAILGLAAAIVRVPTRSTGPSSTLSC